MAFGFNAPQFSFTDSAFPDAPKRRTMMARPSQPWIEISASPGSASEIGVAFVRHGISHILQGYDHLLFVLALMLIVRSTGALVWTITAFTVAHSITLALATLGSFTSGTAGGGGHRLLHTAARKRDRALATRRIEPDRTVALGRRFLVRIAARLRVRGRAVADRLAAR
jgi:hypothetical protein